MHARQIYDEYIRPLPPEERRVLLTLLEADVSQSSPHPPRSILDLRGLGKECWEGIDPQHYVEELREEWR